ncbi:MAG TPA: SBBP repeat-containing protein [Niastella sp.]
MKNMLLSRKSLLLSCLFFTSAIGFAQVTEKWVKRQNGDANAQDIARGLVVDCKGNIIVTGLSDGDENISNTNWATIKYNDDGDTKWIKRYNGPGNGSDEATAIATDSQGNVYVTGWSTGTGTGSDYTTIKYNDDGDTKWVKRYNGPGNEIDQAFAIAVDSAGNVYVTGSSTGTGTAGDITTIKYDDDGNTKWVQRYNGPGNGSDQATTIAVDKNGNVYVTGWSTGSGTGRDITIIKYNNDGIQQWVSTYNGPVNDLDQANDLALDPYGNVYITGFITTFVIEGEGNETSIATIKYNASGLQQWAAIYNREQIDKGNALAVDAFGNVYITGISGPVTEDPVNDYVTLKYNTAGVQQWEAIFTGTGTDQNGQARDLVLDKAGNVYITGSASIQTETDYTTVKYNNNGVQQWVATYDGPGNASDIAFAMGIDNNGNIYVTGRSQIDNYDYATVKYNADGKQKWVERFNGRNEQIKGGPDFANALALDKNGNVHVTGGITRLNTGMDYTTYKYDEGANRIWKKTYSGTGIGPDAASAIAVDAKGNVYVTGTSDGGAIRDDYATVKYDKNGDTKWVRRYNGPGNATDQATAIAVDNEGNVYVTGESIASGSFGDYATIKYDKNGNEKWVRRYNGPGNSSDRANAIAVDQSGNVYVTGRSFDSGSLDDYATIKYDANGNELWVVRYNGGTGNDEARALVVDVAGNVYITGLSFGSDSYDYATIKYNTAGVQQWVVRYNSSADIFNSFDDARDIAIDASGNVYVTGESQSDYTTIKYNAAGVEQWVARYNGGPGNPQDIANALALDDLGNVYVTGGSRVNNNVFEDYATVKYNAAGVQQWAARYDGPGGLTDIATAIGLDDDGNVYITGHSVGIGTSSDYATIKYEQTSLITTRSATNPDQNNLVDEERGLANLRAKAFPNAFTQYINLQWSGSDKPVNITITDMLGRLVEKRTNLASSGTIKTGYHFRPGVYFAEIVQGPEKVVVKLIKN